MIPLYENELYRKPMTDIVKSGAFPLHYHRHLEVICVMDGEMGVQAGDRRYLLAQGDIMFAAPYVIHGYTPAPGTMPLLFKAIMDPECLGYTGKLMLEYRPKVPVLRREDAERLLPDYMTMLREVAASPFSEDDPVGYCTCAASLCSFFSAILRYTGTERIRHESNLCLQAVRLCYDRYSDPTLRVETIADEIHISAVRLQQIFTKTMNLGVKEYITMLRMCAAESMLCETHDSAGKIAAACGYQTTRSFNRAFHTTHGISPGEYRRMHQHPDVIAEGKNASITSPTGRKILSNFELFYRQRIPEYYVFNMPADKTQK